MKQIRVTILVTIRENQLITANDESEEVHIELFTSIVETSKTIAEKLGIKYSRYKNQDKVIKATGPWIRYFGFSDLELGIKEIREYDQMITDELKHRGFYFG